MLRDCVVIATDRSTAHGNEHHIPRCHAQLWIQLPVKGEASSSAASIHAEKPQLQFKQKSAGDVLQEPCSATACVRNPGETGSNKTIKFFKFQVFFLSP